MGEEISVNDMFVALASAFSCLVSELEKAGSVESARVVDNIRLTALAAREKGEKGRAAATFRLADHLFVTTGNGPSPLPRPDRP